MGGNGMSEQKRLRVGLIGAGTIAFSAHLPAIRILDSLVELVAVADVREENAERAAREYGAQAYYSDYRDLLARGDIDFVDICTPEFLHAEQTEAAAAAGVHVLCEKPMSSTPEEADRMIAACENAGVTLMIAHSRRFTGRYRQIRAAIDRGEIGDVRYVRENERRPVAMYDSLDLGTGYWVPEGDRPWIAKAGYSQGAALTNAVHETDLARWFIGANPVSIFARAQIVTEGAEVPDMLSYTVAFDNGAIAAAEIVNQLPPGYPYFHMMEVIGRTGRIKAIDPPMSPLTVADRHGITQKMNFPTLLHVDEAYVAEIESFARAIQRGEPPPLSPHDARAAVELSVAAVRSSELGQPVSLPLKSGENA
jgi:myo-inositol 2-dehydrogenase / D-chiro-inositol 1-dehydrogenase